MAALFPGPVGITVLLINSAVWGFGWPMLQDALNARIGEARRATVLSIANLSVKLGFIPCSALLGLLEEAAAASGALAGLAAFMALAWLAPGSPLRRPEGKAKPGVSP